MADEDFTETEDKEADVYGDNAREDLAENDEITPEEQAFMDGYDEGEDLDEKTDNDKYEKAFEEEGSNEERDLEEEDDFDEEF
jgi:hypothetical protein